MLKSLFDKLASKGSVCKTKTLTVVTFSNARDLKALTKELTLAETPFKVSGLVVKVKTNQLDSFADLAAFIMNG